MSLVLESLAKRFHDRWALRDVSLQCETGLVGLVGPNGAGKTTLMRIIATLLDATSGTARWKGQPIASEGAAVRSVLGYLPQHFGVYPEFTGRRFLRYLAAMKGLPDELARRRVDEVLDIVNLAADADRRLRTYSGGMLQRIGIGQALLNDPELLIVDEPTVGLDPAERVRFRTLLAGLTEGRLVMLSTHIVSDVEAVAGRLVIMRDGRILADTTPEQLMARTAGSVWSVTTAAAEANRLQAQWPVSGLVAHGSQITLRVISETRPLEGAVHVEPTLEDAYLLTIGARPVAA